MYIPNVSEISRYNEKLQSSLVAKTNMQIAAVILHVRLFIVHRHITVSPALCFPSKLRRRYKPPQIRTFIGTVVAIAIAWRKPKREYYIETNNVRKLISRQ